MQHFIYQITNAVNSKIYVGAHSGTTDDDYMGSGKGIKAAIRKYGREHFSKQILYECMSVEEMFQRESEIVNTAFVNRPDTYNRVVGGRYPYAFDEATKRRRISAALKGRPAWNKGRQMNYSSEALQKIGAARPSRGFRKKHSIVSREKMRQARVGKIPWNKGKPPTEETRMKLRQANLGKQYSDETKQIHRVQILSRLRDDSGRLVSF
jgi:hypothetical protein